MALAGKMEQLTICGVGLMGGSLALAARERGVARRVVGIDTWPKPPPPGLVDVALRSTDLDACREAYAVSDLTVLAVPVGSIQALLPTVLHAAGGSVVTDFGSTKR